jgi:hypothetical protein
LTELIGDAKRLSKQLGADLWVYLSGEAAPRLRAVIEKTGPGCVTQMFVDDNWSLARTRMFADVQASGMIFLPQERRNSVLWTPSLDRLPDIIAERFPQVNFVVAYPALPEDGNEGSVAFLPSEDASRPEIHAVDFPPDIEGPAAILHLVRRGLGEEEGMSGDACGQLMISARHHPVEVTPGIFLIHAHCGTRGQPVLLVGMGRPRHPFFEFKTPPRAVLALISPRGQSPEAHLQALAAVAKQLRDPGRATAARSAVDAAALAQVLSGS